MVTALGVGLAWAAVGTAAGAQAVVSNGTVSLGVFPEGHLNYQNIGVTFVPTGNDGTSPGCLCEGWGAGVNGGTVGWASEDNGGISNVTVVSFAATATNATSVVRIGGELEVTHVYSPTSVPNLYRVEVTITNISGATLGAGDRPIRYQRSMDWDIGPTEFDEFVTIAGAEGAANVIGTNNNGFDIPDITLDPISNGCPAFTGNFTRAGSCDHGANFLFGFPALDAGSSRTFTIFYGAAPDRAAALAALGTVGAEIYSFGECNPEGDETCLADGTPNTFIFGFAGVGGTPLPDPSVVPEPSTVVLTGIGLVGMLVGVRRRRSQS
jgi:hypothetical protein